VSVFFSFSGHGGWFWLYGKAPLLSVYKVNTTSKGGANQSSGFAVCMLRLGGVGGCRGYVRPGWGELNLMVLRTIKDVLGRVYHTVMIIRVFYSTDIIPLHETWQHNIQRK
jgi:hypothetical protein